MPDDEATLEQPQDGAEPQADYTPPPGTPEEAAEWLRSQPDEVRSAFDSYTKGLRTGLEREREGNKDLRGQLKTIAAQTEGRVREELDALGEKLQDAERRMDFQKLAFREGIEYVDLAYSAAVQVGAFDKHGVPDFSLLRAQYPKLFTTLKPKSAAQAGAGTGTEVPLEGMNALIRRSTGRV